MPFVLPKHACSFVCHAGAVGQSSTAFSAPHLLVYAGKSSSVTIVEEWIGQGGAEAAPEVRLSQGFSAEEHSSHTEMSMSLQSATSAIAPNIFFRPYMQAPQSLPCFALHHTPYHVPLISYLLSGDTLAHVPLSMLVKHKHCHACRCLRVRPTLHAWSPSCAWRLGPRWGLHLVVGMMQQDQ